MTDVKRSKDNLGGVWDCLLTYCRLVPSISNFECLEARPDTWARWAKAQGRKIRGGIRFVQQLIVCVYV